MSEGDVIAISVGVCTAVLVIILALIAALCQRKLNKKHVEDDKEKLEGEYGSIEEPGDEDGKKVQAGQNQITSVHTTATQTPISHKDNVFFTKSSSTPGTQYQNNILIPKMISSLPLYAGQVKQAESKPRTVTEGEKKQIISNLKKQYPTKPIPIVTISQPKEKKRQECYVDNWLQNQTFFDFSSVASVDKYSDDHQTDYESEQMEERFIPRPVLRL